MLILLFGLAACEAPTPPVTPSARPTVALPTRTNSPSPPPPSQTAVPTATRPPTATVAPPTPTPRPTLTAAEEQALVSDLLLHNEGCQLPCWWGFTPGTTTWPTVLTFLSSNGKSPQRFQTQYEVDFRLPEHDIFIHQTYLVINPIVDLIIVQAATIRENGFIYGDPLFLSDLRRFLLPQVLTSLGTPTEVMIETFTMSPEGHPPFGVLLHYQDLGISVEYRGLNEIHGEQIRVCPQQAEMTLWLWRPEKQLTLDDLASIGLAGLTQQEMSYYLELEKATGMSVQEFYETFRQPDSPACFDTPIHFWTP